MPFFSPFLFLPDNSELRIKRQDQISIMRIVIQTFEVFETSKVSGRVKNSVGFSR
jgi:hypothetical protein